MKNKNTFLFASIISLGMLSACNHNSTTQNKTNTTTSNGSNSSNSGVTVCPAWGCGAPPITTVGNTSSGNTSVSTAGGGSSNSSGNTTPVSTAGGGSSSNNGGTANTGINGGGGNVPAPRPTAVGPEPIIHPISPEPIMCPSWGCTQPPFHPDPTQGTDLSVGGDTKDVDLQRADLQNQNFDIRANAIAEKFSMNFDSARQLAVLADHVQTISAQGMVSAKDEQGVIQTAVGIAGLSQSEITNAIAQSLQGDDRAVNAVMEKAAQNLGMSSTATLRDELLPALGLQ